MHCPTVLQSIWPCKSPVFVEAGAFSDASTHCGSLFSLLYGKDVYIMGQHCLIPPLNVNKLCVNQCSVFCSVPV